MVKTIFNKIINWTRSFLLPAKSFPEISPPVMNQAEIASAFNRLSDQDPTLRAVLLVLHSHWQAACIESQSPACANREYWSGSAAAISRVLDHLAMLRQKG